MDFFCKGFAFGLVTGMIASAVIVSKNKNLSNMIKEKSEIASKKISRFAGKVKECFSKKEEIKDEICHEMNGCNCNQNFDSNCNHNFDNNCNQC